MAANLGILATLSGMTNGLGNAIRERKKEDEDREFELWKREQEKKLAEDKVETSKLTLDQARLNADAMRFKQLWLADSLPKEPTTAGYFITKYKGAEFVVDKDGNRVDYDPATVRTAGKQIAEAKKAKETKTPGNALNIDSDVLKFLRENHSKLGPDIRKDLYLAYGPEAAFDEAALSRAYANANSRVDEDMKAYNIARKAAHDEYQKLIAVQEKVNAALQTARLKNPFASLSSSDPTLQSAGFATEGQLTQAINDAKTAVNKIDSEAPNAAGLQQEYANKELNFLLDPLYMKKAVLEKAAAGTGAAGTGAAGTGAAGTGAAGMGKVGNALDIESSPTYGDHLADILNPGRRK